MQEAGVNAVEKTQNAGPVQPQAEGLGSQVHPASVGAEAPPPPDVQPQKGPTEQDMQRLQAQLQLAQSSLESANADRTKELRLREAQGAALVEAAVQDDADLMQLISTMLGMPTAEDDADEDVNEGSDYEDWDIESGSDAEYSNTDGNDDSDDDVDEGADYEDWDVDSGLDVEYGDMDGSDDSEDHTLDGSNGGVCQRMDQEASHRLQAAEEDAAAARENLVARMAALRKRPRDHSHTEPVQRLPLCAAWLLHSQCLSAGSMALQAEVILYKALRKDGHAHRHWPSWRDALQHISDLSRKPDVLPDAQDEALQDQPKGSLPDISRLLSSREAQAELSVKLQQQQRKKLALAAQMCGTRETFKLIRTALIYGDLDAVSRYISRDAMEWDMGAQFQVRQCLKHQACQAARQEVALCNHLAAYVASEEATVLEAGSELRSQDLAAEHVSAPVPNSETHEHQPLTGVAEPDAAVNPTAAAPSAAAADGHDDGQVAPSIPGEPLAGVAEIDAAVNPPPPPPPPLDGADGCDDSRMAPPGPGEPLQPAAGVPELSPESPSGGVDAGTAGGDKAAETEQRAVDTMSQKDMVSEPLPPIAAA